ncbi:MAG TPA: hypothetical protein VEK79_11390 [Thermoanaerobaculia bacterium]|nr:hypothetical protein [Thermoanaerobaculia bacterium]
MAIHILRVVVVSPADVGAERDRVNVVAAEINRTLGDRFGVRLDVLRWETDVYPMFHVEGPQGQIDDLLKIEDADLIIGIFWKRFGTPVMDADSGTEHELRKAFEAYRTRQKPGVMLYCAGHRTIPKQKRSSSKRSR